MLPINNIGSKNRLICRIQLFILNNIVSGIQMIDSMDGPLNLGNMRHIQNAIPFPNRNLQKGSGLHSMKLRTIMECMKRHV